MQTSLLQFEYGVSKKVYKDVMKYLRVFEQHNTKESSLRQVVPCVRATVIFLTITYTLLFYHKCELPKKK
jgi:hypothetical protein